MRSQDAWSIALFGLIHLGVLAGDRLPSAPALELGDGDEIVLPDFLQGKPEDQQVGLSELCA